MYTHSLLVIHRVCVYCGWLTVCGQDMWLNDRLLALPMNDWQALRYPMKDWQAVGVSIGWLTGYRSCDQVLSTIHWKCPQPVSYLQATHKSWESTRRNNHSLPVCIGMTYRCNSTDFLNLYKFLITNENLNPKSSLLWFFFISFVLCPWVVFPYLTTSRSTTHS